MDENIKMKSIILSIIVPIYNAESDLNECLESLSKVQEDNIEIILVDDGSTDDSSFICEKFTERDERFILCHKKNGGVSSARNYGLKEAQGEFVYFMDSDDYINSDKFSKMMKYLERDIEVLCFLYLRSDYVGETNEPKFKEIDRSALLSKLRNAEFSNDFGYVWNKIYKKKLIELNNIVFEEKLSEREDFLFNVEYFKNVNNISFYEDYIYYYIQNEESLSRKGKDKAFIDDFIQLLDIKLRDNYLNKSIIKEDVILELIADYIVKSVFSVGTSYQEIKLKFKGLLMYSNCIKDSKSHNLYLKILRYCFQKRNIYPFYFYYKLSELKKKIKLLKV